MWSETRTRPAREQTRARLIGVAAELFAERGVMGTSIEDVVAAAGDTRGAFYSSFADRDDLAYAVTEHSFRSAIEANRRLLAEHGPGGLIDALRRRSPSVNPLLGIELLLHAPRTQTGREQYAELLEELRAGLAPVVETTLRAAGVTQPIDALGAVTLLMAVEDGIICTRTSTRWRCLATLTCRCSAISSRPAGPAHGRSRDRTREASCAQGSLRSTP